MFVDALNGFYHLVGTPRFELGQTEPKSVVLPLHHIPKLPGFSLPDFVNIYAYIDIVI